jgi:hypothetical protein
MVGRIAVVPKHFIAVPAQRRGAIEKSVYRNENIKVDHHAVARICVEPGKQVRTTLQQHRSHVLIVEDRGQLNGLRPY